MNYTEVYDIIREEGYSHETALATIIGLYINVSKKTTMKHLQQKGLFWKEIAAELREASFLTDKFTPVVLGEALGIVGAWYGYSTRKACAGIGGCEVKTLRECIKEVEKETAEAGSTSRSIPSLTEMSSTATTSRRRKSSGTSRTATPMRRSGSSASSASRTRRRPSTT